MLVCIQAIVLMMVCHASPSGISGRFIDTLGSGSGGSSGGGTTFFGTFLFQTTGNDVLVAFGDCDLLRRL